MNNIIDKIKLIYQNIEDRLTSRIKELEMVINIYRKYGIWDILQITY